MLSDFFISCFVLNIYLVIMAFKFSIMFVFVGKEKKEEKKEVTLDVWYSHKYISDLKLPKLS